MAQERGEHIANMRCPLREFQEALEVTKCGVMQYVGRLDPFNVAAAAVGMYLFTVLQISQGSAPPAPPPF